MMILGCGRRILAGFPIVHSFSLQIIFMALVWSFFCIVFLPTVNVGMHCPHCQLNFLSVCGSG